MEFKTKWNIGDRVYSYATHCYDKDVPCTSCGGEGGALIPGTGVRVECQDCNGTGQVLGQWWSFDVWHARIDGVSVDIRHSGPAEILYSMTGIWESGEVLGCDFNVIEHDVFDTFEAAHARAVEQAKTKEDGRVKGVQYGTGPSAK
jgi:hypothetical protein